MSDQHSTNAGSRYLVAEEIAAIQKEVLTLREEIVTKTAEARSMLDQIHPNYRASASNLLHYLALRRHDLRALQLKLAALGLSSLGRAESHVLATIDAILEVLQRLNGTTVPAEPREEAVVSFASGNRLLVEHTEGLLGFATAGRWVRIMVTMPSEAADDYDLVYAMLRQGMDCMRINCAHDDADAWLRMIDNLRKAEKALGKSCRIVMDLAGPKLRTGLLEPGPQVVRIRPSRDTCGNVTAPARVWLTRASSATAPPTPAAACLHVPENWFSHLRLGEVIKFTDARAANRKLKVIEVTHAGCWAESTQTAYVVPSTVLAHERGLCAAEERFAVASNLPATEKPIELFCGDRLIVTRDLSLGRPAVYNGIELLVPAKIGCTIPQVFENVRPGQSIWFDDGKIGGVVEQVEQRQVVVRITHARLAGEKLWSGKGINLPDSNLDLPALTTKDLEDLAFVVQHADVVELSFCNTVHDVELLQEQLARCQGRQPSIVLKIETRRGFENLPLTLLTAMRAPQCGVMIARGDLAVECGFERLAEVQEEILWICEAAHVPVIWATQVLESLSKDGMPSLPEITDAAMGRRPCGVRDAEQRTTCC